VAEIAIKPAPLFPSPVCLEAIEKLMPVIYLSLWGSGKRPLPSHRQGKIPLRRRRESQPESFALGRESKSNYKEGSRLTLKTILSYGFRNADFDGWEKSTKSSSANTSRTIPGKNLAGYI